MRLNHSVAPGSVVLVDVLDEARQLLRGSPYRSDRLVVVHANRAKETDGAEHAVRESVRRSDECGLLEGWMLELPSNADERAARIERLAEDREQCGSPLERDQNVTIDLELVRRRVVEEPGR